MVWVGALVGCSADPGVLRVGAYAVREERGARQTPTGDRVEYTLFVPQPTEGMPGPPRPAVVLMHGFARDKGFHKYNAVHLASRGFVVLTPDGVSLLSGETGQRRNISNAVDHVRWLQQRSETPGDSLFERVDVARIGLAGHSAGGAIVFEAAIDGENLDFPVQAVCLLDAVPWSRTLNRAAEFPAIALASFRSEPSSCNADGKVRDLLALLPAVVEDIRIVGASHCSPENPSDSLCPLACGGDDRQARELYQRLMYLFLRDALGAERFEGDSESFEAALDELAAEGRIAR
jgi:dienelactone hydrolase